MQWFKSITTHDYMDSVKPHQWPQFHGRLWQRRYYEHIIRDDRDLDRIRAYIASNPSRWAHDDENPERTPIVGVDPIDDGFAIERMRSIRVDRSTRTRDDSREAT